MKRAGAVVACGAVLILAAFTFDSSLLFVPGLAFLALAATVPPWIWLASCGASVTRRIDTERVLEDQPLEARIEVRAGPLGVPGGEILDPLAGGLIPAVTVPLGLSPRETTDVRVIARFPRRGRRQLESPALVLRDPLGLASVVRTSRSPAQTVLVLPRTERVQWSRRDPGVQPDHQTGAASLDVLAATDLDGLRPYRRGTPASRISWPALARGAGLLERRMRVERDSGPLIVLDLRCDHPERIDAAVRAAASLVLELARRGGCDLLLPGDRRPLRIETDLGAWAAAHARLALIEGGPRTPAPSSPSRPRGGAIFYVAAQHDELPRRLVRGGQGAAVLVLPKDLTASDRHAACFEVAGCRGYLLAAERLARSEERAA